MTTLKKGTRTPPIATNWTLTMMAPEQPPLRLLREMRTLATALDEIAAGRYQFAADVLAQRIKAVELFQSDGTWNRAQYLELLDAEPSLLGRDEAVMVSKEWAGELKMRRPPGRQNRKEATKTGGGRSKKEGRTRRRAEEAKARTTHPPSRRGAGQGRGVRSEGGG